MKNKLNRPQIETLGCPYPTCQHYAQNGAENLTVRKVYGKDHIRYLCCSACSREFSERKGTTLFNTKIEESKAISVAEHLAEGVSTTGTSRLVSQPLGHRAPERHGEEDECLPGQKEPGLRTDRRR
jgi:hypothetical protein